jgi:hypothetical protein
MPGTERVIAFSQLAVKRLKRNSFDGLEILPCSFATTGFCAGSLTLF